LAVLRQPSLQDDELMMIMDSFQFQLAVHFTNVWATIYNPWAELLSSFSGSDCG